ncbi:MAG TPA: chromosomal replication initiator protein DnaA [Acidimicrobiales bacterium]|nr:chromosomal replication initiator protein DnaA [Acidimicrobiales bacterium]
MDDHGSREAELLVTDAERLWKACADVLRAQVSDATWMAWFEGLAPVSLEGPTLTLTSPSSVVKQRLEERYKDELDRAATGARGAPTVVDVRQADPPTSISTHTNGAQNGVAAAAAAEAAEQRESMLSIPRPPRHGDTLPLTPEFTFDAFVIGESNSFAHAAARAVAETPGRAYNPLFVYGESGLGKTHLLHAIGNYVRENFPHRHVRYVTTETFMNEFVDAIRTNSTIAFKRRYRESDVLLIDDIQFIESKEGLQEEVFHTFNDLRAARKQVVITSDRPPKDIATLEDRLRSRFMSGLLTDVQPPQLETRLAILQRKTELEPTEIPHEVLVLIATHVKDNIRELEGALTRVVAFASLNRKPITLELAEHLLTDLISGDQPRQITPQDILDATAAKFGFSIEDLCGQSRRRPLVTARQVGMYVFREITDFSYPAIAKEFGGRDHTTVIHAVTKIEGLMKEKREIYDQVTSLVQRIKAGG